MATQPEVDDLELDTAEADQDQQDDQPDGDQQQNQQQDEPEEEDEILFGDDPATPAPDDSSTIRHLRDVIRQKDKMLAERPAPQPSPIEVGPKPTLEACEWDEERFEFELTQWHDRQRQAEEQKTAAEKQAEAANRAMAADRQAWADERAKLRVPGKEDAAATVEAALSAGTWHPAAFAKLGADAAKLEVALASNPARLAELMAIDDPIKFAIRLGELKGKITVRSNQRAPAPEQVTTGNAGLRAGGKDQTLERLEKDAAKTGDRTKLIQYRRQLREKVRT